MVCLLTVMRLARSRLAHYFAELVRLRRFPSSHALYIRTVSVRVPDPLPETPYLRLYSGASCAHAGDAVDFRYYQREGIVWIGGLFHD